RTELRRNSGRGATGDVYAKLACDVHGCHLSCIWSNRAVCFGSNAEHNVHDLRRWRAGNGDDRYSRRAHLQRRWYRKHHGIDVELVITDRSGELTNVNGASGVVQEAP